MRLTLLLLLSAVTVLAQQDTTLLRGHVEDPQGARVPAVELRLTATTTGFTRTVRSNPKGNFEFAALPPGDYQLEATAANFKPYSLSNLTLTIRTPRDLIVRLELPGGLTAVEISATANELNARDASIGNSMTGDRIVQLPLEGRNLAALLSLQPGVTFLRDTNTTFRGNFGELDADPRNGAVNGGRSDQANYTLDGVDINDPQTGFAFSPALRLLTEAIQEFRVVTAMPDASLGRSSGAQAHAITRSGANSPHGALFGLHRNQIFSANSFFNNRIGATRPKLVRNVFGASAGGALRRDKLFLFGAYEGRRDASETTSVRNVPTALFREGTVTYRTRNNTLATLSPAQLAALDPRRLGPNPNALNLLRQYPLPNDLPNLDPLNFAGYRWNAPFREELNTATLKLDAPLSERHHLFLRGNLQWDRTTTPLQFPNTLPPFQTRNLSKGLAAGHTWSPTASLTNSARYGLTYFQLEDIGTTNGPLFSFGGGIAAPVPLTYSRGRSTPTHSLSNDLSYRRGNHSLELGGVIRFTDNRRYNVEQNRVLLVTQVSRLANGGAEIAPPDLLPANQADYVRAAIIAMGVISQGNSAVNYDRSGNVIPQGEPIRRQFSNTDWEGYIQDFWRLRPSLTLGLGLRYSYSSPTREDAGLQAIPDISVGDYFARRSAAAQDGLGASAVPLLSYVLANPGQPVFADPDRNNFAPRLSLAWSPTSRDVFRGGLGIVYDRAGAALAPLYDSLGSFGLRNSLVNAAASQTIAAAPRFVNLSTIPPEVIPAPVPFQFPITYPRAAANAVGAIIPAPDRAMRTPWAETYSASWQRQWTSSWSTELGWHARRGQKLLSLFDAAMPLNLRDPQGGATYFEAARALVQRGNVPLSQIDRTPYWENLFPALATTAGNLNRLYPAFARVYPSVTADTALTSSQVAYFLYQHAFPNNAVGALQSIDVRCAPGCSRLGAYSLYSPQFASLFSWRSIGDSFYNSLQLTVRRRARNGSFFEANYTLARSEDWTSGVERGDAFSGSYVINSFAPEQMRAPSDFDLRHQFNAHGVWTPPAWAKANWLTRDWQLSGILRLSSGFPVTIANGLGFPTNHYFRGFAAVNGPLPATTRNKDAVSGPNLFANPAAAVSAFVSPLPGETGIRNNLRGDGLFTADLGLGRSFPLPWGESHRISLRAEAFNLTNSVRFDTRSLNTTSGGAGLGTYSAQLVQPRVVQFLLRYSF